MSAVVYRCYDSAGQLLYVGCTRRALRRRLWEHHRGYSPWWPAVARVTVEAFALSDDAAAAEVAAIQNELPVWNMRDRSHKHPDGFINWNGRRYHFRDEHRAWQEWRRAGSPYPEVRLTDALPRAG